MFVYGPPGNGKTVISQAIRQLLGGEIAIPQAIEVEGNIMRLFDPVTHEVLPEDENQSLDAGERLDGRWVRCRRPLVMVGGELTLDALDAAIQRRHGVLPGAHADCGEWRRAGDRRFRTPAVFPSRPAEPLDRAARKSAWTS